MRKFLVELKRRHVFRVGTVYLVAAWLTIQVATTVFPILRFPAWSITAVVIAAIVGFPVTLVIAWALDLTSEGVVVTDEPHRRVRLPWLRPAIALVVILIAMGSGYAFYLRVRPSDAPRAPSVAIFPFVVEGSPSLNYLGEGIVNLLSTSFNGLGTMRSVDPTTLLGALSERERSRVTREVAQRIAEKMGASSFIIGQIEGDADRVDITATLYDVDAKEAPASSRVRGREAEILDKVDELAGLLITEGMRDQASRLSHVAAITTNKLSALKLYLMGEAEYREARWPTAMSFFSRAVAEDTTFALASYRLAVAADWASQFDTARAAVQRSLRHAQRLSNHDRDLLIAFNSAVRGRHDEAEAAYRRITSDYPDDVEAWYRYGEVLYHYNPVRGRSVFESRPIFERAVHGAPDVEPMVLHLMELALYEHDYNRFDELAKSIDRSKAAALRRVAIRDYESGDEARRAEIERTLATAKDGDVLFVATGLAQFAHDLVGAERVATILTDRRRAPHVRGTAFLAIAQYNVTQGNWTKTRAALQALRAINPAYALEHEALWASLPFFNQPDSTLQRLRAELQAWHPAASDSVHQANVYLAAHNGVHGVFREYLIGVLSARLHDDATANQSAKALDAWRDTTHRSLTQRLATAVRAHVAFNHKDYQAALDQLTRIRVDADLDLVYNSVFWNGAYERYLRAESLRALRRGADAKTWYESLNEGRNEVVFQPVATKVLAALK